jgi:RNA polymerase sigma factor (sigma-70 family)
MQTEIGNTGICDELFLQRYDEAFKWALRIAGYDRAVAEDLVQTFYLQFKKIFLEGKSVNINSFDSYAYVSLRNLYVSHLKKNIRQREKETSAADFLAFAVNPQEQLKARENLFAVCRYACLRKETSISGSVLILRYFHGYFPSEVAQILKSSRNVVEVRLAAARRESIAYLENPQEFGAAEDQFSNRRPPSSRAQNQPDTLQILRRIIFGSRRSVCFEKEEIREKYFESTARLTRNELSHLVSCRQCLDETNKLHGLMLLDRRHPLQSLGRESGAAEPLKQKKFFVRSASA